jgi:HlyD family secretion protein
MPSRRIAAAAVVVLVLAALTWWLTRGGGPTHYTGFVEGEDRVLRSEVSGRVLEVLYAEGDTVSPSAVVARLDDEDVRARVAAKRQQVAVLDAEIRRQQEQVQLVERTWRESVGMQEAALRQAQSAAELAERTFAREQSLVATGASTAQLLDDTRSARDQARSARDHARDMLARARAQEGEIAVARQQVHVLGAQRELALAELAELEVLLAKYALRAPSVATVVQTQYVWPGELAQPGTAVVAVLDPADKYVQVYVPVPDVGALRVGRRVEIELDSNPGVRVPGEVTFVADEATFTPEKIETRSDRLGQVYRAKVRILGDVAGFQPGTEGNVYLVEDPHGDDHDDARVGHRDPPP